MISEHADWDGLLATIRETGAERIGLLHGYTGAMKLWPEEQGYDGWAMETTYEGETEEGQDIED